MGKDNLLQDLSKNEEKENHNEEDEEWIDHTLTPSTSNSKPITDISDFSNGSYDSRFLENYSRIIFTLLV